MTLSFQFSKYQLVFAILFFYGLLLLSLIDLRTGILPDFLTLPLILLGLIINSRGLYCTLSNALIGVALAYLGLQFFIWIFKRISGKVGMGQGDVKMFALIGAWLGWHSLSWVLLLASVTGMITSIVLVNTKKLSWETRFPFGPYLAVGSLMVLIGNNYFKIL